MKLTILYQVGAAATLSGVTVITVLTNPARNYVDIVTSNSALRCLLL